MENVNPSKMIVFLQIGQPKISAEKISAKPTNSAE